MIQLYICFSICYLTIYVVGLSQAFEGSSILLQTLIEWLIVLIDVLVYYCRNNLLRRLNAWLRGCRWWKSEISQNAKMCVRQHLWSWCLPAWNVSSVSFSTDADWPADFFFSDLWFLLWAIWFWWWDKWDNVKLTISLRATTCLDVTGKQGKRIVSPLW